MRKTTSRDDVFLPYHQSTPAPCFCTEDHANTAASFSRCSWLSSADNENNKFSSFAIKAEQVWLEAVESSDYALGNDKNPNDSDSDIHDWTPHRNKTAAACEILLNITEIFGRFKTFMKPVTTEVIRSIYDDAGDILENPRMSRIQLQSGVPFHELHKRLENEVTELREELR